MGNKVSTCKTPKASRCCKSTDSSDTESDSTDTECCLCLKCCPVSKTRVQVSKPKEEERTDEEIAELREAKPLRTAPSVEIIGMRFNCN